MIAVAGGKGGVGKTTTALGIAMAFAAQRRRPLVVDADTDMPDLGTLTGVDPDPGLADVGRGADPRHVARPASNADGVAVIPTAPGATIRSALQRLPRDRPVLLDCPAGAGDTAVTPLRVAETTILVTTPDRAAIEDTMKSATLARAVDTPVQGVIVTRTDTAPDGLGHALETDVLGCVPAVTGDPLETSAVRATYDRLAARLRGKR